MRLVALALLLLIPLAAPGQPVTPAIERPTLHIVSVGINEYEDVTLRGAINDATLVDSVFAADGARFFGRVASHVLTDAEATTEGIEHVLASVAREAKPEDTMVFFFAGVGRHDSEGSSRDLALVPFGGSYSDGPYLNAEVLALWLAKIPARRAFVAVDACSDSDAARSLARALGPDEASGRSLVVVAPGGLTMEIESEDYGVTHGAFTLGLVRAYTNEGSANGAGVLTAHGIGASLPPEVAAGDAVTPIEVAVNGPDFVLGLTPGGVQAHPDFHYGHLVQTLSDEFGPDHPRVLLSRLNWLASDMIRRRPEVQRARALREDAQRTLPDQHLGRAVSLALYAESIRPEMTSSDLSELRARLREDAPVNVMDSLRAEALTQYDAVLREARLHAAGNPLLEGALALDLADHGVGERGRGEVAALVGEAYGAFRRASESEALLPRERALARRWAERIESTDRFVPPSPGDAEGRGPNAPRPPVYAPSPRVRLGPDVDMLIADTYFKRLLLVRSTLFSEAPVLRLTPLATDTSVVVIGHALDEQGIASVEVNGRTVETTSSGRFTFISPPGRGATTFTVRATDANGTVTEERLTVEPPALRRFDVAEGAAPRLPPRRDMAVFFATDDYLNGLSPLSNPIADAEAIAAELRDRHGFDTLVVRNPTREDVERTLIRYEDYVFADNEDSQLFVFFAGHGTYVERLTQGYIQPADAVPGDRYTYLPMRDLAVALDGMTNFRRILLVLDVCYGGAVFDGVRDGGEGDLYAEADREELLRRIADDRSRLALTSGGVEYVSDGVRGRHSPFAARVLEALRSGAGPDRLLLFQELVAEVQKTNRQEPQAGTFGSYGDRGGLTFVFAEQDDPE